MSDLGAKFFWGFMAILMVIVALFLNNEEADCNLPENETLKSALQPFGILMDLKIKTNKVTILRMFSW